MGFEIVISAEEAIAKARQVLNNMGLSLHFLFEVIPGREELHDVWYVRAHTAVGALEVVIDRSKGEVLAVRRLVKKVEA
ncbi:MAG: hypothetical protein DRJ40_02840 [Thermoprotei archaeon]|mgnify:CR=1 FL=1|nr:MAG: hypothetical protein DRJ40_02840 [Thermoprotei archaeon]